MKPPYAVYLLESKWAWDHFNTEIATITVEGVEGERWQSELEKLIDPSCLLSERDSMLLNLKEIAKAQNNCVMDRTPQLVCLYRVVDSDPVLGLLYGRGNNATLKLTLQLICEFDSAGNPVMRKKDEVVQKIVPVPYRYGEKVDFQNKGKDYKLCPESGCGKPAVSWCRCSRSDTNCSAGHSWHLDDERRIRPGSSHR